MKKCQNEQYLAIISGKILIMNEQKTNQLFIFKRIKSHGEDGRDKFEQVHRHIVKDLPIFQKVCMDYHFKYDDSMERDTIIFCKIDEIFELKFKVPEGEPPVITTRHRFVTTLKRQPLFFQPNME